MSFNTLASRPKFCAPSPTRLWRADPISSRPSLSFWRGGDHTRRCADRHRQDRRIYPAAVAAPEHPTASAERRVLRALILTPTRELAATGGGKRAHLRQAPAVEIHCGVRGVGSSRGHTLRRGVDILVATPGRLHRPRAAKTVDLSKIEILVLDEADACWTWFIREQRKISRCCRSKRKNLLFSPTFSDEISSCPTAC